MYRVADSHCDLLAYRTLGGCKGRIHDQSSYFALLAGGVKLQNFALWVPPDSENGYEDALFELEFLNRLLDEHPDVLCLLTSPEALEGEAEIKLTLSVESGESIGCDVELIDDMYRRGARMLSLTWNGENEFASGCEAKGGLKSKGRQAVERLSEKRMALDVSHLNEEGFWQAADIYRYPLCATHSCAFDICGHTRNLKKSQIKHIIDRDGYIGVNFYPKFLSGGCAKISDVLRHVDYILSLGGEDCVGFGSDFCGIDDTPAGLESSADFQKLPEAMQLRGYSRELIEKICYGNFERFILKFL